MRILAVIAAGVAVGAGPASAGVPAPLCASQEINVMQHGKATPRIVGGGLVCATRTPAGAHVSLTVAVALPPGRWTVYFNRLYSLGGRRDMTAASMRATHVSGGTTVVLTDRATLADVRLQAKDAVFDQLSLVKGTAGCVILRNAPSGPTLTASCPVWAATRVGFVIVP